jgi:hypothetical protein
MSLIVLENGRDAGASKATIDSVLWAKMFTLARDGGYFGGGGYERVMGRTDSALFAGAIRRAIHASPGRSSVTANELNNISIALTVLESGCSTIITTRAT